MLTVTALRHDYFTDEKKTTSPSAFTEKIEHETHRGKRQTLKEWESCGVVIIICLKEHSGF